VVQPGDSERSTSDVPETSVPEVTDQVETSEAASVATGSAAGTAFGNGAPVTKADGGMWIVFAAVGFLLGEIVGVVFTVILADILGQSAQLSAITRMAAPPEWYIGAGLVGLWIGFLGGSMMASHFRGTRNLVADFGIRFRPIDVLGVVVGVLGQLLVIGLYAPFETHIRNFNAPVTKLTGASHGGGFVVIAILTVLGAPFFEELFFRGLLFGGLLRVLRPGPGARPVISTLLVVAAVLADGLLFGLAHGELVQLAGLAIFGAILAVLAYRTKRLGMSMVAHASFNLYAVLAIASSRSGAVH
jgi:membrane protease YdiL (CAAX protease family)